MADTPVKKTKAGCIFDATRFAIYMLVCIPATFKCSGVVVGEPQGEHAYGSGRGGGHSPDGLRH